MPISFEVRETDLMGRIGVLRIGRKSIETPCLIPVIHPVARDLPLSQLSQMGFGALMTNSLIIYRRRRDEALRSGLHEMLGYDGIVMTDSGGYQALEYGQVDVTPSEIASFQSSAGSDLAVTLDRPTGYSLSRKYAKETMEASLRGARETIREFASSRTTWVGPVQGGLFHDIVRRSAKEMVAAGFEMLALGSPVELMDNYLFAELVGMIAAAKRAMPFSMPLHLFGAGHPLTLPISVALGCDTFDSASYVLFAKEGRYMTERGTLVLGQMQYLPCSCPVCNSTSMAELLQMERRERVRRLALHNLYILRQDVLRCRQAISEGRLWDLVEERAAAHPRVMAAFEEFVKLRRWLGEGTPLLKERGLMLRSAADRTRPEVDAARGRVKRTMRRRAETALLICLPEERPLSRTRGHEMIVAETRRRRLDLYKLHPQVGLYPAELEFVYPFTQTVTEEKVGGELISSSLARLRKMGYSSVLLCDGDSIRRTGTVRSRSRSKAPSPYPSPSGPTPASPSPAPRRP